MSNVVEKFKKGYKIHIKESQKGSFTKWCGGNVTSECIQRGKNSSNPKIRKKATFAANARKWKHKEGGLLKFQEGGKNINGSPSRFQQQMKKFGEGLGNFFNSSAGQTLLQGGLGLLFNKGRGSSHESEIANSQIEMDAADKKQQASINAREKVNQFIQQNTDPDNPNNLGGEIIANNLYQKFLTPELLAIDNDTNNRKAQVAMYSSGQPNLFLDFAQNFISNGGIQDIAGLFQKKTPTVSNNSSTFYLTPGAKKAGTTNSDGTYNFTANSKYDWNTGKLITSNNSVLFNGSYL